MTSEEEGSWLDSLPWGGEYSPHVCLQILWLPPTPKGFLLLRVIVHTGVNLSCQWVNGGAHPGPLTASDNHITFTPTGSGILFLEGGRKPEFPGEEPIAVDHLTLTVFSLSLQ